MLSKVLSAVTKITKRRAIEWIKDHYPKEIIPYIFESINLKEDYERALFVRLGYQSIKSDWRNSIDAMTAIELLDISLLIVDDIIDESPRRVEKKAIHKAYGIGKAIIFANMLKSNSTALLVRSAEIKSLKGNKIRDLIEFAELYYSEMYVGEYQDIIYENTPFKEVSIEDYLEMIKRTTGFHFGMAIKIGGLLAGGDKKTIENLWRIGVRAGIILQIRDDFVDYLDIETITHKPAFGDFIRRKKRLPLILAHRLFPQEIHKLENIPFDEIVKKRIQAVISSPQIVNAAIEVMNKIYLDTDDLIREIDSSIVRKLLYEYFKLMREL